MRNVLYTKTRREKSRLLWNDQCHRHGDSLILSLARFIYLQFANVPLIKQAKKIITVQQHANMNLLQRKFCYQNKLLSYQFKYQKLKLYATYDEVAEWLRRWTANPLGSARVGSNPILVAKRQLFFNCYDIFASVGLKWSLINSEAVKK